MGVQQDQTALTNPAIPGFSVYVTIGGKRAPLYDVQTDLTTGKSVAWIEAVEEAQFAVHYEDMRPSVPISYVARVRLDGQHCNGMAHRGNTFTSMADPRRLQSFHGSEESATMERPFLFGKLQLTDSEEEACSDENLIKNLGSISLIYCRVNMLNTSTNAHVNALTVGNQAVHEKAKKAQLSHRATVGAAVPKKVQYGNRVSISWIDPEESPMVSFEFRYRSRQLLQLEGHMEDDAPLFVEPHAPVANGASGSNANNDGLSRKERIAKMRAEMARLDADSDDDDLQVDVKPKKAKIEDQKVKPEKGVKTEGKKVQQEIIVLSDSD